MTNVNTSDPNSLKIQQIARDGYKAVYDVEQLRSSVMAGVKEAASSTSTNRTVSVAGATVDISTGAGALVLDDYLQELSTVEQAAAQLVAAENKSQKQVHSVTGQG